MACEHCLNRRDFLSRTGGLAVAAAAAACGDGVVSGVTAIRAPGGQPPSGKVTIQVGNFPSLATEGVLVQVSTFYAVKRTGTSTFQALSMACTHEGCLIEIVSGQSFECPCHGSRFANDGSVVEGPATRSLQTLPTSYDPATDVLTIN